jgi:adenylate kinase
MINKLSTNILILLFTLVTPALHAEEWNTQKETAVLKVLDAVIDEQRGIHTCLSLDAKNRGIVKEFWEQKVAETRKMLADEHPSLSFIAKFESKTQYKYIVDTHMTLQKAMEFCDSRPNVIENYMTFNFKVLPTEVHNVLHPSKK